MSPQLSTLAEEFGLERDENLVFALEYLGARDEAPTSVAEGKLRIGNLLILAKGAGCLEVEYQICIRFEAVGTERMWVDQFEYVSDELIEEIARFMKEVSVRVPDSFNDELQVLADLAHTAGLEREVQWLKDTWGVEPSPSVTALLAGR